MTEKINIQTTEETFSMEKFINLLYDQNHDIPHIATEMYKNWLESCGEFDFPQAFDSFIDFNICKFCDSKNRAERRIPVFTTMGVNNHGVVVLCNEKNNCYKNALAAARRVLLNADGKIYTEKNLFVKRTNGDIDGGWKSSSWYYNKENNQFYIVTSKNEDDGTIITRDNRINVLSTVNSREVLLSLLNDIARQVDKLFPKK